jgi:anti-sigma regulatory factor (Ser/Thr protein kinase)
VEDTEISRRFARSTLAPSAARRFLAETLCAWDLGALVDDGNLVLSELASNAVLHARSDFTIGLSRRDDGVRVVVGDTSPVLPRLRDADVAGMVGGFGLRLVAGIAREWGHQVVHGGKIVWADLGTTPGAERPRPL